MAQFNFLVGRASKKADKIDYTQDHLSNIAKRQSSVPKQFIDITEEWLEASLSTGGQITSDINYDLKQTNGVHMMTAFYTFQKNGVDMLVQFFEVWDRGQTINFVINFPLMDERRNDGNIELIGKALDSITLR